MKFDERYPAAQPGEAMSQAIVRSLHAEQERPCSVCREPTRSFHREFLVHVCSEECVSRLVEQN